MERREFLRYLGVGVAAGWAMGRLAWPLTALAGDKEIRLALLADAHLADGDEHRPEAQALARAVAEIRALRPAPDLVLFVGDLAHQGDPQALALGQEILSHLPAPVLMLMGEGDGVPDATGPWPRLFGRPWFSCALPPSPRPSPPAGERESLRTLWGETLNSNLFPKTENRNPKTVRIIGLHTAWVPSPEGPVFTLGEAQRRWLAQELARLDPAAPLLIFSHAPLIPIFRPWQQWTADAHLVTPLLARFRRVLCLHGHVHGLDAFSAKVMGFSLESPPPLARGGWGEGDAFTPTLTLPHQGGGQYEVLQGPSSKASPQGLRHYSLPATAWPLPQPLQGTPGALGPGLGPAGCGWGLVVMAGDRVQFQPRIWSV